MCWKNSTRFCIISKFTVKITFTGQRWYVKEALLTWLNGRCLRSLEQVYFLVILSSQEEGILTTNLCFLEHKDFRSDTEIIIFYQKKITSIFKSNRKPVLWVTYRKDLVFMECMPHLYWLSNFPLHQNEDILKAFTFKTKIQSPNS